MACRNDHREDVRSVFAWVFAGSSPTDAPAATPAPTLPSRLVFLSDRDGNYEIYVINADGIGLVQLTQNADRDWNPT